MAKRNQGDYSLSFRGSVPKIPGPMELARRGVQGRYWYHAANNDIARYARDVGTTPERVAAVLAITSPRVNVRKNVGMTKAYIEAGSVQGLMKQRATALHNYDRTGVVSGPKVNAFRNALLLDESASVVDIWVVRAFGVEWPRITPRRYRNITARMRGIATRLGWPVAQTQAAMWVGCRRAYGHVSDAPVRFYNGE